MLTATTFALLSINCKNTILPIRPKPFIPIDAIQYVKYKINQKIKICFILFYFIDDIVQYIRY